MIRSFVEGAEVKEIAEEETPRGKLWSLVQQFVAKVKEGEKTDLRHGKAVRIDNEVYVPVKELIAHLERLRFTALNNRGIFAALEDKGVEKKRVQLPGQRGSGGNRPYWFIFPAPEIEEPLPVPEDVTPPEHY
jgi:hypothetical protein